MHLTAFGELGVIFSYHDEEAVLSARQQDTGTDKKLILRFPSVGATENILLCTSFSGRKVDLYNAAREPEIIDLQTYLNKIGAEIAGAGTSHITIYGKKQDKAPFQAGKICRHTVIPDRIECGTYLLAAAICGGTIELFHIDDTSWKCLQPFLKGGDRVVEMGTAERTAPDCRSVKFTFTKRPSINQCITTLPYPGIPTDLQAPLMSFLATVDGTNYIIESVFKNRVSHVEELRKMGAYIKTYQNCFLIRGQSCLYGSEVTSGDLRGGAALVIAALGAVGTTVINDNSYIARGYANIEGKLQSLGTEITKKEITKTTI